MKIAYIISMKKGILPFIFSEMEELEKKDISFKIFPTKLGEGMNNPKNNWEVYKFNPLFTVLKQPFYFLKNPLKYTKLFFESVTTNSLIDFLVATDIKEKMLDVDRIHSHFGDDKFFIGYYCKKFTGKPLSVTIHAHSLYRNRWKIFRKALEYCDDIISISDYNKEILIKKFSVPNKKIKVNRLFVHTDEFRYEDKIKILIVASFHKKKGHEILFKAIKKCRTKNLEVWVVGDKVSGYAEQDLEGLAVKTGIKDKVCFFGLQTGNSLKALYNECDIFCLPSIKVEKDESEGIPVALMEAMSFSKPVISTKHAGIPELVEGELVREKNVNELAKAIDKLASNKELRQKQGKRNRKIIQEKYSKDNLANLIKVFKDEK